ncbi:MAG: DUF1015 domain-containing protein [Oscillospiraceae bacterium]|nr:DUF1015 domain-containing protein [Oscillospiraceae bacterium]
MNNRLFLPADILIPRSAELERWSVIACDQFTSDPDYWDRVEKLVGDAPSTLRLILPEAHLGRPDTDEKIAAVNRRMLDYLGGEIFTLLESSYIYVERRLSDGAIRRGLVGAVDLEAYSYRGEATPIRPTERTVEERLPPRVKVRSGAVLELPHIMLFINDPEDRLIGCAGELKSDANMIYDFELMEKGGHITGWRLSGQDSDRLGAVLDGLGGERRGDEPLFAIGDGNHSLAAAKLCWDRLKAGLTPEQCECHPARYALVELVNLYDDAVSFEPIHRVIFGVEPETFLRQAEERFAAMSTEGDEKKLIIITRDGSCELNLKGVSLAELVSVSDSFLEELRDRDGCAIDYIHGDEEAAALASRENSGGILLPRLDKAELFGSIAARGVYPKKSFSIGHAVDKRYYLECRRIDE